MFEQHEIARMANDIARHFAAYPSEEAVSEIANHIRSFWTSDMRTQIYHLARSDGGDLSLLAHAAALTIEVSV